MMKRKSIEERVIDCIKNSEVEVKGMAKLSDRAVALIGNDNETDVFFDALSYKIIFEEAWKDDDSDYDYGSSLFPPITYGTGLGILPGTGRGKPVRGYDDALQFARTQLRPLFKDAIFYHKPVEIKEV